MTVDLPDDIVIRLKKESSKLNKTIEQRVLDIFNAAVAPAENFDDEIITSVPAESPNGDSAQD